MPCAQAQALKPNEPGISTRIFEVFCVLDLIQIRCRFSSFKIALKIYIPLKISQKTQNKLDNLSLSACTQGNTVKDKI